MKINIRAFALTTGLFWGVGLFLITWWLIMFEGVSGEATIIGRVYIGYNITPIGSIIGFLWGLFDGIVGGSIFAWLYNFLSSRLTAK